MSSEKHDPSLNSTITLVIRYTFVFITDNVLLLQPLIAAVRYGNTRVKPEMAMRLAGKINLICWLSLLICLKVISKNGHTYRSENGWPKKVASFRSLQGRVTVHEFRGSKILIRLFSFVNVRTFLFRSVADFLYVQ